MVTDGKDKQQDESMQKKTEKKKKKIVVLISGSGSNLQALIDAIGRADTADTADSVADKLSAVKISDSEEKEKDKARISDAAIVRVVSSSEGAYGVRRAEDAKIATTVHQLKTYYKGIPKEETALRKTARAKFDADLASLVLAEEPDLVVCAGWMLILSLSFLQPMAAAEVPVINLHPALPGTFDGTHAIERSFDAGQKGTVAKAGCMVHYVVEAVDRGAPIVVRELAFVKGETLAQFEARVHEQEHVAVVDAVNTVLHRG